MSKEKTALMISIDRKRNRLKFHKERYIKPKINETFKIALWNIIETLEIEIQEDEKLLEVEREQLIKSHISGQACVSLQRNRDVAISCINEKYGTDGE